LIKYQGIFAQGAIGTLVSGDESDHAVASSNPPQIDKKLRTNDKEHHGEAEWNS
jgi:hypothetical protein